MPPTVFFSQEPKATVRMSSTSRQRPLHACGVSILAIADLALVKIQHINGPLGSPLRKIVNLAKFFTPLIYALQYQWLAILSFIDNRILSAEKIAEKLFPPSTHAFDKVDEVVLVIVSLPEKFDYAVTKFPAIIHEVPFVEWTLSRVTSRLNSLASTLNHWGHESSSIDEKTIGIDRSCNEEVQSSSGGYLNNNIPMDSSDDVVIDSDSVESFPPIPEAEHKGIPEVAVPSQVKGSYKEALLERGKEEEPSDSKVEKECENEKKINGDVECEASVGTEKSAGNNDEVCQSFGKYQVGRSESVKDDPILQLFESAWLMTSGR
ncbi:uncharacterized protein LOC130716033 [Lotus japonicus]|uniref:uncharacterized protein LOC130716033 n=1 Tax=Lotus japonicus TaxID=34305 RepID=UPI002585252A|nr:uncharacterized protein LOC130716033 [Lotus japonicus]